MVSRDRMSPFSALFLGIFGVGAVTIAASAGIVLYGMRIIDTTASSQLWFAEHTIEGLPELIDSLPPTLADLLSDRRAPDYAGSIDLDAKFITDERSGGLRPVMTITNNGDEVVSMLAVRVAALNDTGAPVREWTEVVATPIAIDDNWRGPLMPNATRHVVISSWRHIPKDRTDHIFAAAEISELRIWKPTNEQ